MTLQLYLQEISPQIQTGEDSTKNELIISKNLREALDIPEFYNLPFEKIYKIVHQSDEKNFQNYHKLLQNLSLNQKQNAAFFLNFIDLPFLSS
jgi:predicted transcriptional regulator